MRASRIPTPRAIAIVVAILAIVAGGGYGVASWYVFDTYYAAQAIDQPWCTTDASFAGSTPGAFETGTADTGPYVDTTPYLMPEYADVSFPSQDPRVTIAGWWVPGASASSPAVILVHGRGRCRWDPEVLLPAGMLYRHGFSVLLIDLRNHGDSTSMPDPHTWAGVTEYQDVLGAWNWVRTDRGIPADRIGLYGVSLGAGTSLIAMGEEPRVAATWEDSSFASMEVGINDALADRGLPGFLGVGAIAVGRIVHGIDLSSLTSLGAMAKLDGRPIAIVHGTADATVPLKHADLLLTALRAAGGTTDPWILPDVGHVRASFVATAEYDARLTGFFSAALGDPGASR